ncbi:(E2-independent) E3 ubiquitin-conjugating enzyme FATS [Centroberyx gerrardi]
MNPAMVRRNEFRQSYSTADGFAMREPGKRKIQPLQHRHSYTEGDRNQDLIGDSFNPLTSQPSYRSCVHLEVPLSDLQNSVSKLFHPLSISLKEALELFRPDFISRSQGRVRRLEQRARRRRAVQDSNLDLVQGLGEDRGKRRRNCTTPDPLSDNLFKPRERSISGREMQLRSRRIYNKLPEVTKKKEEEKKRAVSQTNRLRAELFKKRLLDQILQR